MMTVTLRSQADPIHLDDPKPSPSPSETCMSVLHKCDAALQAEKDVNAIDQQIIADEEARFAEEHKELEAQSIWKPLALGGGVVIAIETLILVLTHK